MTRAVAVVVYLAWNTVREALASRLLPAVLIFGGGLLLGAAVLGALTLDEPARATRDLGLAGIDAAAVAVAVLLGVGLTAREMDGGSAQVVLTRPVARWQLLTARWLGVQVALLSAVAALALLLVTTLLVQGAGVDGAVARALWLLFVGAAVAASLAVLLATVARPLPAGAAALGLVAVGRSVPALRMLADRAGAGEGRVLRVLAGALPNLQLYTPDGAGAFVGGRYLLAATTYGLGYSLLALGAAALVIRRRDFV